MASLLITIKRYFITLHVYAYTGSVQRGLRHTDPKRPQHTQEEGNSDFIYPCSILRLLCAHNQIMNSTSLCEVVCECVCRGPETLIYTSYFLYIILNSKLLRLPCSKRHLDKALLGQ